jgi:hypothetical protein
MESMIKEKPLVNELIHAITNTKTFPGTLLLSDSKFSPKEQSVSWYNVQASLLLDRTDTDAHILAAVSLLRAYPKHLDGYANTDLELDAALPHRITTISGGSFATVGGRVGTVLACEIYPMATKYTISYSTADSVDITTDTGKTYTCKSQAFDEGVLRSLLGIDWGEKLPFKGPMHCYEKWLPGSSIDINYVPTNVNYQAWVDYIETHTEHLAVLLASGLVDIYISSQSPSEKLALLILALAVTNNSIS